MKIEQHWLCEGVGPSSLPIGEVHLWMTSLERPVCESNLHSLMNAEEQVRAARYKVPRIRRQFVVGRGLLRKMLSQYLLCSAIDIRIEYGPSGKPFLPDFDLEFNLTHAESFALMAFARGHRVGVDLEPIRVVENMEGLVDRFFSSNERTQFHSLPESSRVDGFFRGWTTKEAVLKALGQSVQSLDRFDVEMNPANAPGVLRLDADMGRAEDWSLIAWQPCEGFTAAVAVEARRVRADLHMLPPTLLAARCGCVSE